MSSAQFSFHFRKEFLSNLPNIFILAIGVKYKEVSVCIAELIYRMVIYATNIDVVKCVSDLLAFDDDYKGEILELINEFLKEHIRRMDKAIKTTEYPVEVVLQMMDYPALNQEEYEQCIASITEILERL